MTGLNTPAATSDISIPAAFEQGPIRLWHFELVHDAFEAVAAKFPEAIAVESGPNRISYGALNDRAEALAQHLAHIGVTPGSIVPIIMRREIPMLVSIMAVLKSGAAYAPLDAETPATRIQHVIETVGAKILLATSPEAYDGFSGAFDEVSIKTVIVSEFSEPLRNDINLPRPSSSDAVYIIATSGTSGVPKLVEVPHRAVVNVVNHPVGGWSPSVGSRVGSFLSTSFDSAAGEIFTALSHGATLVLRDDNVPWESIIAGLDSIILTPTALQLLEPRSYPRMKRLAVGGEPMPPALLAAWRPHVGYIANLFGPSEATIHCTTAILEPEHEITIGRPISNVVARVLDNELHRVPIGTCGELFVGGIALALGYYGLPELTQQRFIPDPFSKEPGAKLYATGDVVKWLPDGNLAYMGRKDSSDDVKVHGHRVNLQEISQTILQHPSVKFAVTIVKDGEIVSFVTPRTADAAGIHDTCTHILPHFMVPRVIQRVDSSDLPMTANGKVDRWALKDCPIDTADAQPVILPNSLISTQLADIWARVLGYDSGFPIGIETPFFQLAGGDSISAVRATTAMALAGFSVSIQQFFKLQTIKKLEAFLNAQPTLESSAPSDILPSKSFVNVDVPLALLNLITSAIELQGDETVAHISPATPFQADIITATAQNAQAYIGAGIWDVDAIIDYSEAQKGWRDIIAGNDIFRSTFATTGEGVFRVELASMDPTRTYLESMQWNAGDDVESNMTALLQKHQATIKTSGRLFQAAIVHLPDTHTTRLIVSLHHSLYDGASLHMLIRDFLASLNGDRLARRPMYREWDAFVATENVALATSFWSKSLSGLSFEDQSLDALPSGRDMRISNSASVISLDQCRAIARAFGVTVPTVIRAGWALTLSAFDGGHDHVFGEVFSGRDKPVDGIESLMGPTITTVPFRVRWQSGQTLADLLGSIQDHYLDIIPIPQVAPHEIARSLNIKPSRLFPSFLALNLEGDKSVTVGAYSAKLIDVPDYLLFPLAGIFELVNETVIAVKVSYDIHVVAPEHANAFQHRLASVLSAFHRASCATDVPTTVEAIVTAETQQLVAPVIDFEQGTLRALHHELAHDAFLAVAVAHPDLVAVEHGRDSMKYGEVQQRALGIAQVLSERGVGCGAVVPIVIRREVSMLTAILGVLLSGAAYLPIDSTTPLARIQQIIREVSAPLVLATSDRALEDMGGASVSITVLVATSLPSHPRANVHGSAYSPPRASALDPAYFVATSGTTGVPKLVPCQHRSVVNVVEDPLGNWAGGLGSRVGNFMGVGFDCSVGIIMSAVSCGATLVLRDDSVDWTTIVQSLTHLGITPTGLQKISAARYPSLQTIIVGGEPMPSNLLKTWDGLVTIKNIYGPSESTILSTATILNSAADVSIGRPIGNTTCRVLNKDLQRVAIGVPGQLFIGGLGLASGYHNNSALTASKFCDDPFLPGSKLYATGDICKFGFNGELYYLGRADSKDDIKVNGYRVNLEEISHVISKHPSVYFGITIVSDSKLIAYVSPETVDIAAVRESCILTLPHYMIPAVFIAIARSDLPMTINGKVDRQALSDRPIASSSRGNRPPISSSTATQIADVWAQVLGINADTLYMDTSFFELPNADSISAVRVSAALTSAGLKVSPSLLFRRPTISELEQYFVSQMAPVLAPAPSERSLPLKLPYSTIAAVLQSLTEQHGIDPTSVEDILRATPLQSGMCIGLLQSKTKYVGAQMWKFDAGPEPVSFERLELAWRRLLRQHSILRTRFIAVDGTIYQVVIRAEEAPGNVEVIACDDERYTEVFDAELSRGMELGQPMSRLVVVTSGGAVHRLILALHHSVYDGYSLGIIEDDFRTFYSGEPGEPSPSYSAFVHHTAAQTGEPSQRYWKSYLDGCMLSDALTLPQDPTASSATSTTRQLSILMDDLRRSATQMRVTPATLINAAWAVVLKKFLNRTDVIFGNVLSGRDVDVPGVERLVGMCLATVPVRVLFDDPNMTVAELCHNLHVRYAQSSEHAHAGLLDIQKSVGHDSSSPLFHSLLTIGTLEGQAPDGPRSDDLHMERVVFGGDVGAYPADLTFRTTGANLEVEFLHDQVLLDSVGVASVLDELEHILRLFASSSAKTLRVSHIPLSSSQISKFYAFGEGGAVDRPFETLHDGFMAAAAKYPSNIAIDQYGTRITYRELDKWSDSLAARIQAVIGDSPGSFCGIICDRRPEFVVAMLAVSKAGAAFVPLDITFPPDRLAYMIKASQIKLILSTASISLERKALIGELPLELIESSATTDGDREVKYAAGGADRAYVVFSSGTTGKPKPIVCCHSGAVNNIIFHPSMKHIRPGSRIGQMLAISFDGQLQETFGGLFTGATVVLREDDIFNTIKSLDVLSLTPSGLQQLDPDDYPNLICVFTCGEALPKSLVERWGHHVALYSDYGPSEACISTSCNTVPYMPHMPITLGRPFPNMSMMVLDAQKRPLPIGVVGELVIGGVGVAEGYLDRPELNAAKFVPNPFVSVHSPFKTMYCAGDLVRWLPHGELQFFGRDDTQVKLKGYRIELEEVATVMQEVPGVRDAIAIIRQTDNGSILVGFVASATVDMTVVRLACQASLPAYEVPAIIVILDEFPLTPIGKIDRAALQRWELTPTTVTELSERERAIQHAMSVTLNIESGLIGAETSFFEKGGDSLSAIRLVAKARDVGLLITVPQIFSHPTVATLAACAREAVSAAATAEQRAINADPERLHHYNQSLLLRLRKPVLHARLETAVKELSSHHDMLRAKFLSVDGRWTQHIVSPADHKPIVQLITLQGSLQAEIKRISQTLDIVNGPLYRVVLVEHEGQNLVFMTVHHLVVDIVSFSILRDDLEKLLAGISLGDKTTSFGSWVGHLAVAEFDASAWDSYLTNTTSSDSFANAVAGASGRRETIRVRLSSETSQKLNEANTTFRTNTQDLVLSALTLAHHRLNDSARFSVCLESHGRSTAVCDADVSRTVGWFTSTYPVSFDVTGIAHNVGAVVRNTKKIVRGVPDGGASFEILKYLTPGRPDTARIRAHALPPIEFNYFGHVEHKSPPGQIFANSLDVSLDVDIDFRNQDIPTIISCYLENNTLCLEVDLDPGLLDRDLMGHFTELFVSCMDETVEYCCSSLLSDFTPSDFSHYTGSSLTLDEIKEELTTLGLGPTNVVDIWRATPAQTAFFLSLSAGSEQYSSQTAYEFIGPLDTEKFTNAWQAFLISNPSARSTFVNTVDGIYQVVLHPSIITNSIVWLDWPEESLDRYQREYLDSDFQRGFTTNSKSFSRLAVARVGGTDRWRCIFTQHHLCSDGWSHALELEDLMNAYSGAVLTPREPAFKEYAMLLESLDPLEAHNYWKQLLSNRQSCPPLGFAPPHVSASSSVNAHDSVTRQIQAVLPGLSTSSALFRTTLSTLLRVAWAVTLRCYTNNEDVVFGAVVSGRDIALEGAENVLGTLVNTIPVIASVKDHATVAGLVRNLHDQHVASLPHVHVTLGDIMKAGAVTDTASLFNTILTFQNTPNPSFSNSLQLSITPVFSKEYTEFDINVSISTNDSGGLDVYASFNALKLETHQVESMLYKFAEVLHTLSAEQGALGETLLGDLAAPSSLDMERFATLESGPSIPSPFECLHHGFEHYSKLQPDAIAVEQGDDRLTYGDLDRYADAFATELYDLGVRVGDKIPLVTTRCPELVIAMMAVLKVGAAYAPIDKDYPSDRIAYIIDTIRPKVIICHPSTKASIPRQHQDVRSMSIYRDPTVLQRATSKPVDVAVNASSAAYVIFTSGTTGKPKGVICLHRGVVNVVAQSPSRFGTGPGSRTASILAVSFDMGTWEIQSPLFNGGTVVMRGANTDQFLDVFQAVDTVFITPTALSQLAPDQLPHVKHIAVSGEPCPESLLERWAPHVSLHNSCAPSETTIVSFLGQMTVGQRITMGRPLPNVSCYILDPVSMRRVPFGTIGEIFISGICVGGGYLNNPELTEKVFLSDPYKSGKTMFRSGDLGRFTLDGGVEHLGRRDFQVKVRGFRVELGEVVSGLTRHPAVTDAVAFVHDGALVAFVTPQSVNTADVETAAASFLPPYMVPSTITGVDRFPMNHNGKIDKAALLASTASAALSAHDAPAGSVQQMYAELWATILKIDVKRVSKSSSFHELGGDSISALRVVAGAKKQGYAIKASQVADRKTTLSKLAELTTASTSLSPSRIPAAVDIHAEVPLTPVMHWFFSLPWRNVNWWNQSFLLSPRQRLSQTGLATAVTSLINHHEILRARYTVKSDSSWAQHIVPMASHHVALEIILVSSFDELSAHVQRMQQNIDLSAGVLYQVALFDNGHEQRLWMTVHHICIDLVSWRLISADLEALLTGETLGDPTTTFRTWSEQLLQHASTLPISHYVSYERELLAENLLLTSKLSRQGACAISEAAGGPSIKTTVVSAVLSSGVEDLLNAANKALDTNDQDLILAALLASLRSHFGEIPIPLAVVSHGRIPWNDDLDVSRTIGWFSTSNGSPKTFRPATSDMKEIVAYTRSALASTAQDGFNYQAARWLGNPGVLGNAEAHVSFNYFGRWQVFSGEKAFFQEDITSLPNTWNNAETEILHVPFGIIAQLTSFGTLEIAAEFYSDVYDTRLVVDVLESWKANMMLIFESAGLSPPEKIASAHPVSVDGPHSSSSDSPAFDIQDNLLLRSVEEDASAPHSSHADRTIVNADTLFPPAPGDVTGTTTLLPSAASSSRGASVSPRRKSRRSHDTVHFEGDLAEAEDPTASLLHSVRSMLDSSNRQTHGKITVIFHGADAADAPVQDSAQAPNSSIMGTMLEGTRRLELLLTAILGAMLLLNFSAVILVAAVLVKN